MFYVLCSMENDLQANITGVQVFWDRGANGLAALLSESTGLPGLRPCGRLRPGEWLLLHRQGPQLLPGQPPEARAHDGMSVCDAVRDVYMSLGDGGCAWECVRSVRVVSRQ